MSEAPVLVIGATGILRPACLDLVGAGRPVLAIARDGQRLGDLRRAAGPLLAHKSADCRVLASIRVALTGAEGLGPLSGALVYCPAAPAHLLDVVTRVTRGPVVWLMTSAGAAAQGSNAQRPASDGESHARAPGGVVTVKLGWATELDGSPRWHTPREVSTIALEALHQNMDRTLGTWDPGRLPLGL